MYLGRSFSNNHILHCCCKPQDPHIGFSTRPVSEKRATPSTRRCVQNMRASVAALLLALVTPLTHAGRVTKTITVPCYGGYKGTQLEVDVQ